jgi:hypothetical protein
VEVNEENPQITRENATIDEHEIKKIIEKKKKDRKKTPKINTRPLKQRDIDDEDTAEQSMEIHKRGTSLNMDEIVFDVHDKTDRVPSTKDKMTPSGSNIISENEGHVSRISVTPKLNDSTKKRQEKNSTRQTKSSKEIHTLDSNEDFENSQELTETKLQIKSLNSSGLNTVKKTKNSDPVILESNMGDKTNGIVTINDKSKNTKKHSEMKSKKTIGAEISSNNSQKEIDLEHQEMADEQSYVLDVNNNLVESQGKVHHKIKAAKKQTGHETNNKSSEINPEREETTADDMKSTKRQTSGRKKKGETEKNNEKKEKTLDPGASKVKKQKKKKHDTSNVVDNTFNIGNSGTTELHLKFGRAKEVTIEEVSGTERIVIAPDAEVVLSPGSKKKFSVLTQGTKEIVDIDITTTNLSETKKFEVKVKALNIMKTMNAAKAIIAVFNDLN